MAPVAPVAVIPEDRSHQAHGLDGVLGRHEAERLGQPGRGIALVVGHAEAAAHEQVESLEPALPHDGEQAHVLRPDVHAVVGRKPDRGLELPREILVPVERLLLLGRDLPLALEPDLVVGVRGRTQLERQRLGDAADGDVVGVAQRSGAAHHVPLHVAAGGDGREQRVVDAGDGGLEVTLEHAVELEALPRGDAQGAVGMLVGEPLEREILLAGHGTGRDRHPDHEGVRLLQPRRFQRPPGVAVVLLVGAVELEQRDVVVAEVGALGAERLGDGAAQVPPAALGDLDLGFRFSGHRGRQAFLTRDGPVRTWSPHSVFSVPAQRPLRE